MTTRETPDLSRFCARGIHGFCQETIETCGCSECHFVCTRCGGDARRLYGESVCPACYRLELRARPATRCEYPGCGAPRAYRDPRHSDDYLCTRHHMVMGHQDVAGKGIR